MKFINVVRYIIVKIKYSFNPKIKLPKLMSAPLGFNLELAKSSDVDIKKINVNSNVQIKTRDNAKLSIGRGCFFNSGCIITCRKRIEIGNNVLFGPNVMIFDNDHNYKTENMKDEFLCDDIIIEDNVWIGAGAVILKGTHIGKNSVIGATCVVKGNIEENTVYIDSKNPIKKVIKK